MKNLLPTRLVWYCLVVGVVLGCTTVTPHENYVNALNYMVGKKWTWLAAHHQFPNEKDLISREELPNGNVEKRYKWTMGVYRCTDIYEIDPKTDVIVRGGHEGVDKECGFPP